MKRRQKKKIYYERNYFSASCFEKENEMIGEM